MADAGQRADQLRGYDDADGQREVDLPARQQVGNDAGEDDLGEALQRIGAKRVDHLAQLRRDPLHRIEAIDDEDRCTHDAHHEEDAELDSLEPQYREHDPAHAGHRHQQPHLRHDEGFEQRPSEQRRGDRERDHEGHAHRNENPQHGDDGVVRRKLHQRGEDLAPAGYRIGRGEARRDLPADRECGERRHADQRLDREPACRLGFARGRAHALAARVVLRRPHDLVQA